MMTTKKIIAALCATGVALSATPAHAEDATPTSAPIPAVAPNGLPADIATAAYTAIDQAATAINNAAYAIYSTIDPLIADNTPAQQQLDNAYTAVTTTVDNTANFQAYRNGQPERQSSAPSINTPTATNTAATPVVNVPAGDVAWPAPSIQQAPQAAPQSSVSQKLYSTAQSMVGAQGFDCSGFVQAVYAKQGIVIPRTSYQQRSVGVQVQQDDLTPGDIVFFYGNGHVGIYAGNGQVIHSPGAGHTVVYEALTHMPYSGAVHVA